MKKIKQTKLRLVHVEQLSYSVNGNPRWKFTARTDDGRMQTFKTASTASSAYDCNLNRLRPGDLIWINFRQTDSGTLIADWWEDARLIGPHVLAVIPQSLLDSLSAQPSGADQSNGGQHG